MFSDWKCFVCLDFLERKVLENNDANADEKAFEESLKMFSTNVSQMFFELIRVVFSDSELRDASKTDNYPRLIRLNQQINVG